MRLRAFGLLADDDVDPEPVQRVFVVEIGAAAPRLPGARRKIKLRSGVGGVLQVAPFAAGKVIEGGGGEGEVVAILIGGEQAAAGGEHEAEIIRQAFVDPEEIVLHGLLVVGRGQVGGTAEFSVPRVDVFVGKEAGGKFASGVVDHAALVDAAVVGLVMLQAEVRDVIAERVEEVVVAVVVRAEKFLRLIDQALVVVPGFLRGFEGGGAVGGDVHFGDGIAGQRDDFQKFSGDDGGVDQRGERDGGEVNFVSALAGDGKRRAEFPSMREASGWRSS